MEYPKSFDTLIGCFKRLPGVGLKSAERMAFAILEMDNQEVIELVDSLNAVKKQIRNCKICGLLTSGNECHICLDHKRDDSIISVVQSSRDVFVLERSKEYRGRYHVINGLITASNHVDTDILNIDSLISRVAIGKVKEVILATNPTVEGETTALFIAKMLQPYNIIISRLAYGLPVGGHLDYADDFTISKALQGRRKIVT